MYADPQLRYLAHWLTRSGPAEDALVSTVAQSKVDLNPHQVEAALFALRGTDQSSAFAKGVLLADEVGLGKTIEAGLVLAQHWAAKRRRLLLVVPASLRKQWQLELIEKFQLPAEVVDAQSVRKLSGNPFARDAVVLVSYEYAARRPLDLAAVDWDLVVFDEAHRLRSLHRDGQRAQALLQALGNRQKILLTATPFQNSLIELWSLVHFLDAGYFGDQKSFELQYRGRQVPAERLAELGRRMRPICHRMLRRQVAEAGQISFTTRLAITLDFSPTPEEAELYRKVSGWLTDPAAVAFPGNGRHLVTLVMRKILASSSFAIAETLATVITRLEARESLAATDLPLDEAGISTEDADAHIVAIADARQLKQELAEIRSYQALASRIERNAKGEALLTALERAFASNEALNGAARKAVIFTESVRTQSYLKQLLEAHGYRGRIVLLNGQNTDPASKAIYQAWKQRHRGSARVSGSPTADMKAAIVEAFQQDADLLIATESGAEGINLQFCQILVNYDLPWNPQRIEQRIGRVHRYGQKCDVFVVNLVNTENQVDKLVHEILSKKLKLFEGVFGSSDEVLGAIEAGIDLERRINDILDQRRGEADIAAAFAQLREELDEVIRVVEAETREKVLASFDHDVLRLLKHRDTRTRLALDERQLNWLAFAQGALDAEREPGVPVFRLDGRRYATDWSEAQAQDVELARVDAEPFASALARCRDLTITPQRLWLDPGAATTRYADVDALAGRAGRLRCLRVTTTAMDAGEYLLLAACTAEGEPLDEQTARRLMHLPAEARPAQGLPTATVERIAAERLAAQQAALDAQHRHWFDQESERLDRWGEDQSAALDLAVKELDRRLKELRKAMRGTEAFAERVALKREIARVEAERDAALADYYSAKKRISREVDKMIDAALGRLQQAPHCETLFCIEWEIRG